MKQKVMYLIEDIGKKEDKPLFDMTSLVSNDDHQSSSYSFNNDDEPIKKKRGRPRKTDTNQDFVPVKKATPNPINSDMSYEDTYKANMQVLAGTVGQIDMMNNQIMQDIASVRNLRNSFKKYEYLSDLASASTSLIGNKISAIREMNSVITKSHDLELKRAKELKYGVDDGDDDKKLMDLYSAFINTPMGAPVHTMPYATVSQADLMAVGARAGSNNMFNPNADDIGMQQYENNLTPQQNAMLQEGNPNIETVLVYDQSTQEKYFEVIDRMTGQPIPNMPLPAEFILEGCNVDINRGIARNSDFNQNFPLKLIGQRAANEY